MKVLFWILVAIDTIALVTFGLLGLAAAGPSRTNPIAALIIPFFIPAALLLAAIWLFVTTQNVGGRFIALLIAAAPVLLAVGGKFMVQRELQPFRDPSGNLRQFRSEALRTIEEAVGRGDAAAVAVAAKGVDLNTPGLSGATVLLLALRQLGTSPNQLEVIRALLAAGANPNTRHAELPLQVAIGRSRASGAEPVRLLLEAGADPNALTEFGDPVFFMAGGANIDVEIMRLLLARGANLQLKDKQGRSAVVLPAIVGNWRVLELVLNNGAPWQDQRGLSDRSFLEYMESEAQKSEQRVSRTNGLAEVMTFLRLGKGSKGP